MDIKSTNQTIPGNQVNVRLEDIGSSKGSFEPVKLDAVEQKLLDLAIIFKTTAEDELSIKERIDTGKLADSIQFTDVAYLGGVYSIDISVLAYYKFVNSGVMGTEGNGGFSSPFRFRNNYVSKRFMLAIKHWVLRNGLKSRVKEIDYKDNYFKREKKNRRSFKESKRLGGNTETSSIAYAIATSIKRKGLKPEYFWDKAATQTAKAMEGMGESFAIDLIKEIIKK